LNVGFRSTRAGPQNRLSGRLSLHTLEQNEDIVKPQNLSMSSKSKKSRRSLRKSTPNPTFVGDSLNDSLNSSNTMLEPLQRTKTESSFDKLHSSTKSSSIINPGSVKLNPNPNKKAKPAKEYIEKIKD